MPINRRELLLGGGALVAARAFERAPPVAAQAMSSPASPPASTPALLRAQDLARFVDRLPIPPICGPVGPHADPPDPQKEPPHSRVSMRQTEQAFNRDLPPTRMCSYGGSIPGPTLETRAGEPLL